MPGMRRIAPGVVAIAAIRTTFRQPRAAGNRFASERMIRFHLDAADLARSRFAISPLMELQMSLTALREPDRHGHWMHGPWMARARPRLAGLDLALLEAVIPARGWVPDF